MNISIIGTGYVGLVTGAVLAERGHNVTCADQDEEKIQSLRKGKVEMYEEGLEDLVQTLLSDHTLSFTTSTRDAVRRGRVLFIAVGTPAKEDGSPDLSAVEAVAEDIGSSMKEYRVIVEKSTVPVETGQRVRHIIERHLETDCSFDVVSNPEFLAEGTALEDARNPDRIVIGVESEKAERLMRKVYDSYEAPLVVTDRASAELIKHASNSFLAFKISFINAISRVCEQTGADVEDVAKGMGLDPRIGESFLGAGIGYGGSCLPKDVEAFHRIWQEFGLDTPLLGEVNQINRDQRAHVLDKIRDERGGDLEDKTVGLLGISFKPGTDDIRKSPGVYLAEDLLDEGARVRVHDPVALENARTYFGRTAGIQFVDTPYEAAEDADGLVLVTDWPPYKDLNFEKLKSKMLHPLFVDGRNVYSPEDFRSTGMTYRSVGRPDEKQHRES